MKKLDFNNTRFKDDLKQLKGHLNYFLKNINLTLETMKKMENEKIKENP